MFDLDCAAMTKHEWGLSIATGIASAVAIPAALKAGWSPYTLIAPGLVCVVLLWSRQRSFAISFAVALLVAGLALAGKERFPQAPAIAFWTIVLLMMCPIPWSRRL